MSKGAGHRYLSDTLHGFAERAKKATPLAGVLFFMSAGAGAAPSLAARVRKRVALWLLQDVKVPEGKFGTNTVTINDRIVMSAIAATQAGHIGMASDGTLLIYRSGAQRSVISDDDVSSSAAANKIPRMGSNGLLLSTMVPSTTLGGSAGIATIAGNGKHGSVTLTSGGGATGTAITLGIIAWDSGNSEYYLTQDLEGVSLTVPDSVRLRTNGWHIFLLDTLTLGANAYVHSDGASGSGKNGGAGASPANTTAAFYGGASGGSTAQPANNSAETGVAGTTTGFVRRGGGSGKGGDATASAGTSSGGAAGTGTPWSNATHGLPTALLSAQSVTANSLRVAGGLGGGSGAARSAAGTTATPGGGGGGGGVVAIFAFTAVIGAGAIISANAGHGVTATVTGSEGAAGGGGGGGGGAVILIFGTLSGETLTVRANGGNGGNAAYASAGSTRYANGGGAGSGGWIDAYAGSGGFSLSATAGTAGTGAGSGGTNGAAGSAGTTYAAPAA